MSEITGDKQREMGKGWLTCVSVSCLSPGREKSNHKPEKQKKKWFRKQKSTGSIEFLVEETLPFVISSSSVIGQPLPPRLPDISPQPLLPPPSPPPPPPLRDISPQPLLPPPSPPPPPRRLLRDISPQPLSPPPSPPSPPPPPPRRASNARHHDSKEAKIRQALALASAVAAEAGVVAAHAAAEVVRLTTSTNQTGELKEEAAAIKIQNAYRAYKARCALRVLRGMARLKTLLQGTYVKRQMNAMLRSMQTLTRLQTQIQERRNRLSAENKARHRLLQHKGHQKERPNLVVTQDFDSSNKSKQQIEARFMSRKEASVRRERALAYSYSHQQTWRNTSKLPHQTLMDPDTPHWGWSWLERWMASRPWDPRCNDDQVLVKIQDSIKTSPVISKTLKSASQSNVQWPANDDSKLLKSQGFNRRHSTGGRSYTNVKDDVSVGSSSSHQNAQTVKSKVSVETTSNLSTAQAKKKSKASTVETTSNLSNAKPEKKHKSSVGVTRNLDTQALKPKSSVEITGNLAATQAPKSKFNIRSAGNLGLQKKKAVVSDDKKALQMVLPKKRLSSSTSLGTMKKSELDKATTGAANGENKIKMGGSP